MNIAISNLAWNLDEREQVAEILADLSIRGVEVAPTKIWPDPTAVNPRALHDYRAWWNDRGLEIVATQSLLFGRPDLMLFGDAEARQRTRAFLEEMVRVSAELGAGVIVFGSPHNRVAGAMDGEEARRIAADLFGELGEVAVRRGARVCLEANPPEYGCDFIQTTQQAVDFVRHVDHPGFRLHVDTSTMTINRERIEESLGSGIDLTAHLHISEPYLTPVPSDGATDHQRIARTLRDLGYDHWVSIEMLAGAGVSNVETVRAALAYVAATYTPK